MNTYELSRTGQAALEITGELLNEFSTRVRGGGLGESRWHEVTLYRCDDGNLIAHVRYRTQWLPGEQPTDQVIESATAEDLIDELRSVNPSAHFVGRPERYESERATNAPKNSQVTDSLRKRFEAIISEAAEVIGYKEVRRSRGRPGLSDGPLVQVGIKMPQDLKAEIDRDRGEVGLSEWLRAAAEHYLARERG